ncbi:MAG: toll/interleukin-1 receptor domain-containing protein, partial [Candidatus Hodarchaeota archaeon]
EESLHDKLSFIDYLIREKSVKEALNNLKEIKDLCNIYGLFEIINECDEKIAHCNYLYLEMINKIKRIVINLATKFARLEIIDISEKTGISDEDFIIEIIEEMIQNNEVYAGYFSKYKTVYFDQQSNIEQIESLIKTYGEWEKNNLDRDDSDLLIEEILPRELRSKPIISKPKPDEFKDLYIFLSYSTIDTDYFQISRVVKSLEEYPEINKVMYWEADSTQNIVEYMDKMLEKCDVFVLFCSENSMKSVSVRDEWQAAFQRRKKGLITIIPVYEQAEHIPVILGHLLKVKYDKTDFNSFTRKLYQEIMHSKGRRIPEIIA